MQIDKSPPFPGQPVCGRRRGRPWRPARRSPRKRPPEIDHDPARQDPRHLRRAPVRRRGPAARRRLHRDPLRPSERAGTAEWIGTRRADFSLNFAAPLIRVDGCRRPITVAGRGALGLLRAVRERAHPQRPRPQGQECRRAGLGLEPASLPGRPWRPMSDSTQRTTSTGCISPSVRPKELFVRGQDRRLPGLSARAAGAARPQHRPRAPQQRRRPALVAVLLLHALGQRRTSSISIRSRPSA